IVGKCTSGVSTAIGEMSRLYATSLPATLAANCETSSNRGSSEETGPSGLTGGEDGKPFSLVRHDTVGPIFTLARLKHPIVFLYIRSPRNPPPYDAGTSPQ